MAKEDGNNNNGSNGSASSFKDIFATVIGFGAFALFVYLIFRLLGIVNTKEELEWTRSVYLLSGVEAILFSATGYFFGEKASRERAESAEEDLSDAQAEASEAKDEAASAKIEAEKLSMKLRSIDVATRAISGAHIRKTRSRAKPENADVLLSDIEKIQRFTEDIMKE